MSAPVAELVEVGELLLELGADLRDGRITDAEAAGRKLLGIVVDKLIPVSTLKPFLSDTDRTVADLAVDVAEAIKVNAAADEAERKKTEP